VPIWNREIYKLSLCIQSFVLSKNLKLINLLIFLRTSLSSLLSDQTNLEQISLVLLTFLLKQLVTKSLLYILVKLRMHYCTKCNQNTHERDNYRKSIHVHYGFKYSIRDNNVDKMLSKWPQLGLSHFFNDNKMLCTYEPFLCTTLLNYLAFQFFDFERTWWRLFQKRVVRTNFDIYVCIKI